MMGLSIYFIIAVIMAVVFNVQHYILNPYDFVTDVRRSEWWLGVAVLSVAWPVYWVIIVLSVYSRRQEEE